MVQGSSLGAGVGWGGHPQAGSVWLLSLLIFSLSPPQGILLEAGRKQPLKLFIQSKPPGTISLLVSVSWGSGGGAVSCWLRCSPTP